jgi:hypothetical protein
MSLSDFNTYLTSQEKQGLLGRFDSRRNKPNTYVPLFHFIVPEMLNMFRWLGSSQALCKFVPLLSKL